MGRTWRSWAVLGATTAVLSACASDDGPPRSADPDTTVRTQDGVALLMETEVFDGAVAGVGLAGEVGLVRGRCIGRVDGPDRLLVFQPGTTLSGSGDDVVVTVGGVELRLGDAFDAGARNSSPRALTAFGDLAEQVPRVCRGVRAWVVDDVEAVGRRR